MKLRCDEASHARLASRARLAAASLPPLPAHAALDAGDRDSWFRELGYTYWNRELVDALAARMQVERLDTWVELAAGSGRLAAELSRRGVGIAATDDHSQSAERVVGRQRAITYGEWVEPLSAREALASLRPDGVVCAWPPLGSCLVPELLAGSLPGSERLRVIICIGEPGGATEAPTHPGEIPEAWGLDEWPECARYLVGFNDPPAGPGWRSHSRLLVYRRQSDTLLE